MNKKILAIIVLIIVLIGVIAGVYLFNNNRDTTETSNNQSEEQKELNAEEIINEIKGKNTNVGQIVVYTEETDLNKLLGRPNQYTSKVTFEDTRLEQNTDNEFLSEEEREEPVGGTIEVFNNEEDMQKRKDYVEAVTSNISALNQYMYSKGNVLLRLEHDLTPTQAKEYEDIFNELIK